jgi:hypothetical protein
MSDYSKTSFSDFSAKDAEEVYSKLKTEAVTTSMLGLTMAVAAVLIITEIWKIYREAYKNEHGKPDIRDLMNLIGKYVMYLAIITALPFIISIVEKLLTITETALLSAWGSKPDVGLKVLEKETQLAEENLFNWQFSLSDPLNLNALFVGIDYALTAMLKPILYYAIKHLYIIALFGRYAYLLLLEIVAPLAIVCLISEKTQQHFYTWVKNMMVCYLLIPGFMLADSFGNAAHIGIAEGDRFTFIPMIMIFILKLALFKFISQKICNLI